MDRQGGNKAFLEVLIFPVPHFSLNKATRSLFMFLNRERPYIAYVSPSITRRERCIPLQTFQTPIGTWDVFVTY